MSVEPGPLEASLCHDTGETELSDDVTAHCHMCDRVRDGEAVLYRDDHFSAFGLADRPGWILYATNQHADWIWGLDDAQAAALGPFLRRVSSALKDVAEVSHVYYVGLGENGLHFHGILAARYEPFAKDIQAALAGRGGEIADTDRAAAISSALRARLAAA